MEQELPRYPGHTAAFGRIMERLLGKNNDSQTVHRLANEGLVPEVQDIQAIRDDELILVSRIVHATKTVNVPVVKDSIDLEIGRRSVAVALRSVEANTQSTAAIHQLRIATERWSAWLTRLTIGILGLTFLLFVLAVAQVVNRP